VFFCDCTPLHTAASNLYTTPVTSFEWQVLNLYDSLVRFCVPVFVMISGAFLLNSEKHLTISVIFRKYISRIVLAFVFWSAMYSLLRNIVKFRSFSAEFLMSTFKDFLLCFFS